MRISVCQIGARAGEPKANSDAIRMRLQEAVDLGAEIVVLPELVTSGYALTDRSEALKLAEPAIGGPNTSLWEEIARRRNVFICGGIAERVGEDVYNSAVLFGPEGCLGIYRKTFLWHRERLIFRPGDGVFRVYSLGDVRVAMSICYDLWHPEVPRVLKLRGADLILSPACWTRTPNATGSELAPSLHLQIAHAHMNRILIAAADLCGSDRGQRFLGMSCIVGPDGFLLPPIGDRERVAAIDTEPAEIARQHRLTEHSDLLADRRPDVIDVAYATGIESETTLDQYPSGSF